MATQAETKTTTNPVKGTYHYAVGRRKTATATVRLYEVAGESTINGKPMAEYMPGKVNEFKLQGVLKSAELDPKQFFMTVKVSGSGKSAQLNAIQHGIARAITKMNPELKRLLKVAGFITRDPRMVERKKPGLHKARKAEQFSKR
jgi:small subunit ribosomal protein S9